MLDEVKNLEVTLDSKLESECTFSTLIRMGPGAVGV